MRHSSTLLVSVLCACTLVDLGCKDKAQPPRAIAVVPASQAPIVQEARVALVIGNGAYSNGPLKNPVNDARAMSAALEDLGFSVTLLLDADRRQMFDAAKNFGAQIREGGVGLFYYAGHGMQVKGANYLIPVGANLTAEDELPIEALDMNAILGKLETAKNRLNIVILDACRNNPFNRSFRSESRGLALMDAPTGTFVAFATAPGSVANDGDGQNGLYTKYLLQALKQPGLSVEQVFKQVRVSVKEASSGQQIPWDSSSLTGEFYFRQGTEASFPTPAPAESTENPYLRLVPKPAGTPVPVESSKNPYANPAQLDGWKVVSEQRSNPAIQLGIDAYERKDYNRAVALWRPLAQQGDAEAQFHLGYCYANGKGVPENVLEAAKWYLNAGYKGNAGAQSILGTWYNLGLGVPRDDVEAYAWFSLSSYNGSKYAIMFRDTLIKLSPHALKVARARLRKLQQEIPSRKTPEFIDDAPLHGPWEEYAVPVR